MTYKSVSRNGSDRFAGLRHDPTLGCLKYCCAAYLNQKARHDGVDFVGLHNSCKPLYALHLFRSFTIRTAFFATEQIHGLHNSCKPLYALHLFRSFHNTDSVFCDRTNSPGCSLANAEWTCIFSVHSYVSEISSTFSSHVCTVMPLSAGSKAGKTSPFEVNLWEAGIILASTCATCSTTRLFTDGPLAFREGETTLRL